MFMPRFIRFNAVGVLGFVVQLAVLAGLVRAGVHYLAATVIAVEAAILHNFVWHERWTWRDRGQSLTAGHERTHAKAAETKTADGSLRSLRALREYLPVKRLAGFHVLNGAVSLGGNLLVMRLLVGAWAMPPLAANLIAVLACSVVNFWLGDRLVFSRKNQCFDRRRRGETRRSMAT